MMYYYIYKRTCIFKLPFMFALYNKCIVLAFRISFSGALDEDKGPTSEKE